MLIIDQSRIILSIIIIFFKSIGYIIYNHCWSSMFFLILAFFMDHRSTSMTCPSSLAPQINCWASQLLRRIGWSWAATISACTLPGFNSKRPKIQHWFPTSEGVKTRFCPCEHQNSWDFFMLLPLKICTIDRKTHPHIRMFASNGSNL